MSTVIGIFEDHYKKKKALPVVKPGTQTRRFTHINDTIEVCFLAWKKIYAAIIAYQANSPIRFYQVAKMFKTKIKFLPKRAGERYASALTNKNLSNRIFKHFGKIRLKDYINKIISKK